MGRRGTLELQATSLAFPLYALRCAADRCVERLMTEPGMRWTWTEGVTLEVISSWSNSWTDRRFVESLWWCVEGWKMWRLAGVDERSLVLKV